MKQWYRVTIYRSHKGAGRNETTTAYIYAENSVKVFSRYQTMPGVKRNLGRGHFPAIVPIPAEESVSLEKRIIEEGRISLEKAKKTWYYNRLI